VGFALEALASVALVSYEFISSNFPINFTYTRVHRNKNNYDFWDSNGDAIELQI
jgi:hypothetical protein